MSRISPLTREDAPEDIQQLYDRVFGEGRDPVASPGTSTGTPGDWYTTWARTPEILSVFSAVKDVPLEPAHKSLALMRTGYVCQSQFVYSQHCKLARINGVAEQQIRDLPCWTISSAFSANERQILAYTDAMLLEGGRVHDALFSSLKETLTEEQILSLSFFVNLYALHARTCRALRMEYDNVPDRIVEIPKPEQPGVQDWRDAKWAEL